MSEAKAAMPASALRFLAVAAANTLIYAGYTMLWIGTACSVFLLVGCRALGEDSAVLSAATTVSVYATIGSGFLLPVSLTLLAARSMASVSNNAHAKEILIQRTREPAVKGPRQILRKILQDPVAAGVLVSFPFLLLMGAGALVKGMSHVKESGRERIGSVLLDVGILGANSLQCSIILPITILRTWRMEY